MPTRLFRRLRTLGRAVVRRLGRQLWAAIRPATAPAAVGAFVDLARSRTVSCTPDDRAISCSWPAASALGGRRR